MTTKRFEGIPEATSAHYTARVLDQDEAPLGASDLATLKLTFRDLRTGAIINQRDRQNVLNANDVTLDEDGNLAWQLAPEDNPIFRFGPRGYEEHEALFEFTYGPGGARRGSQRVLFAVEVTNVEREILRGDDYRVADNRSLEWSSKAGAWPSLVDAAVRLTIGDVEIEGEVVAGDEGAEQIVRFQPTAEETAELEASPGAGKPVAYDVEATLSNDHRVTLALGTMYVREDVTVAA